MHYIEFNDDLLNEIIYRGEGNSSIVIALKNHSRVIRLLKKDGKIMRSTQDHHVAQHPMRSIKFIHLIMKPLTDPFLSGATELIHLKSDFINILSKWIEAHRPVDRLDKTLVLDDQYALVMDDLCALPAKLTRSLREDDLCGPTISVEIKPKQGFLPIHRLAMKSSTNDLHNARLKNCCLYGATQYLKLARGRIDLKSEYCPINLFSGCTVRMRAALESLIKNPQNNLRVFKDLKLVYGENNQVKLANIFDNFFGWQEDKDGLNEEEKLIDLLIQCLLNDNNGNNSESTNSSVGTENLLYSGDICLQHIVRTKCKRCDLPPSSKKHKFDNPSHRLTKSCVLSSVLRAQKLDSIGPHEALNMLEWLLEHAKADKNFDLLEELSKPQMPEGFGSLHQLPQETQQQYYFRKVWEFLVSLTAKDCSIIVTLRRIATENYHSVANSIPYIKNHLLIDHKSGSYYLFNVGIADLDQKMPLKIPRICDNLNLILQARGETVMKATSKARPNMKVLLHST